jgi:DNA polymerase-3 subunit alpha
MMDTEELESRLALTKEELEKAYSNIRKIKDACEDYSLRKPLKIPELAWKIPEYVSTADKDFYIKKIPYLFEFIASDYEGDKILANVIIQAIKKEITYQNQETYDAVNECLQMTWDSSIVNKTHWSAYYLNLQKIIDTVWEAGSLVGPGRGSGVGLKVRLN